MWEGMELDEERQEKEKKEEEEQEDEEQREKEIMEKVKEKWTIVLATVGMRALMKT